MHPSRDQDNAHAPFFDLPEGTLRVVQISDTHLYADTAETLLGINTEQTCDAILELVRERVLPVDLVVMTGDIVHDASEAGYLRLREKLGGLGCPVCLLPGNHDDALLMARLYDDESIRFLGSHILGDWLLALLDSTIPGKEEGRLDSSELERLADALDAHPNRPALVLLHHNPLPIGCGWLDTMTVGNRSDLLSVLDRHPQVRGLVFGHVHQRYDGRRNGAKLLGCPSTCIQFASGAESFAVDLVPPGVRWLGLAPNGEIHTGILRLPDLPDGARADTDGYKGQ